MTEVARLAGVSRQTVSRVANGSQLVSPKTTTRVWRVIEELGYRPNMTARALSRGRGNVLGVVTHASTDYGPSAALFGIEVAAQAVGYATSVASLTSFETSAVQVAVDRLIEVGCAGIFVVAPWASDAASLQAVRCSVPMVTTDPVAGFTGAVVRFDEVAGSRAAVEHLLGLGHRTVWHIAGPRGWSATQQRLQGWRAALAAAGAEVPEPLQGDWTSRRGHELGRRLALDPGITAVFAANDQTALGVVRALAEAGRDVPGDVSVAGYDDLPDAPYFSPPLTTVRNSGASGQHCVDALIRQIDGGSSFSTTVLPTHLVVRGSTAPPPVLRPGEP